MAEIIDRSKKVRVAENLSPAQQAVVQKLLKSFRIIDGVNLSPLDGVKVILSGKNIKIEGLKVNPSGQQKPYSLTVEMKTDYLEGMTKGDFAVLFGNDLAETLTCGGATAVSGAENGGDAASVDNASDDEVSGGTVEILTGGVDREVRKCLPEVDPALGDKGPSREVFAGVDVMDEGVA